MRCKACDSLLNSTDLKRFSETTKEYLDLCSECFETIRGDITIRPIDETNFDAEDGEEYDE